MIAATSVKVWKKKDLDRFMNRSRLKTLVIHSTTAFWYVLFLSFASSLCHERWPLEMDSASRICAVWRIYEGGCSEDGSFPPDQHHQASFSHRATISFVMSCRAYKSGVVGSNWNVICRLVRPPSPVPLPAEELTRFLSFGSPSRLSYLLFPTMDKQYIVSSSLLMTNIGTWQACKG